MSDSPVDAFLYDATNGDLLAVELISLNEPVSKLKRNLIDRGDLDAADENSQTSAVESAIRPRSTRSRLSHE
jgi:hypothetical protein